MGTRSGFFRPAAMLLVAACSLAAAPRAPAGDVRRILIIDSQDGEPYLSARRALLMALESLGHIPGKTLELSRHSIGNDRARAQAVLADELPKGYDVVVCNGTVAAMAAKAAAFDRPEHRFVFVCVTDPVGLGLIDGFDRPPGANFTGVCFPVPVASRLKFILDLMPKVRTIGMVCSDMPQSVSYRGWLEEALRTDPRLSGLKLLIRTVPLIPGEDGTRRMAEAAEAHIRELDPLVDVHMSPNDQLGMDRAFAEMVWRVATRPLIGIGRRDVVEGWGATMSIYPSDASAGRQCARMIQQLLDGVPMREIPPQWPKENGFAFDLRKTAKFGIAVPIPLLELAGENVVGVTEPRPQTREAR